jgi:SanA protein
MEYSGNGTIPPMLRKITQMLTWAIFSLIVLILFAMFFPRFVTYVNARQLVYNVEDSPVNRVAIVFGAGLWGDGKPTVVLRDRVATATELYFSGKVDKLLMSGDNSTIYYNEPGAMKEYAIELGVPEGAIVLDYAGRRTYDSCYRASAIFEVRHATLVTQSFHLPRALYICNALGISSTGVKADQRTYRQGSLMWWSLREVPATLVAFWEVHITKPTPVLGEPEPIYPLEAE